MSKRQFNSFLSELKEEEAKEQLLDLYDRFKVVKEFYDFSFNPNEDKRLHDAKTRIAKEYFPENGRRPKKRRSVAQKLIAKFHSLELAPMLIADVMFYNLEIAQTYTAEYSINQESFYKSMLKSFREALQFVQAQFLTLDFKERVERVVELSHRQEWPNREGFSIAVQELLI